MTKTLVLANTVRKDFGDPRDWKVPTGYRDSLALCVVDAIQSIGIKYAIVKGVVGRYEEFRSSHGSNADLDGTTELLASFESLDGVTGWMEAIGTSNRTFSRLYAPYKAQVIFEAATRLDTLGIKTTADLRAAVDDPTIDIKTMWLGLPGQRSGVSWRYFLMLAGFEGIKPDRMILSYLRRTMGRHYSPDEAADALVECAKELGASATVLDHKIWSVERTKGSTRARASREL